MNAPFPAPGRLGEGRAAPAAGDAVAAAELFPQGAPASPADFESRYWLYSALVAAGEPAAAREVLDEARVLHCGVLLRSLSADMPRLKTDRDYCASVGDQCYAAGLMAPAAFCFGNSL